MSDLIERTKPTEEGLHDAWTPSLRHEVLQDVLAGSTRRVRPGRRAWPLAVAASVVAALMLSGPIAFPGWFTTTAAAEELGKVAAAASTQTRLEWGDHQYLRVQSIDSQDGVLEGLTPSEGTQQASRHVTFDDYYTTDGWTWSDRVANGHTEQYIFPPAWGWMRPDYAATMPTEPHLLDAFLRARTLGSTSQDEAVFVAIGDMLLKEAAPPAVRSAAIGVLGLNPKVTVEHATDTLSRPALKVTFTDEAMRPGVQQYLYLAPDTGVLLGHGSIGPDLDYQSVITNRQVVDALPADLAAALGTEKVGKEVRNGTTTAIPNNAGPDPVPVPAQTHTPAPKR